MAASGPDLRRVVITGMGIVSSIGDTIKDKAGRYLHKVSWGWSQTKIPNHRFQTKS